METIKTKVYYFKYNAWIYVFAIAILVIVSAFVVFDALKLAGAFGLVSYYVGLDIFSLIVSVAVAIGIISCFVFNKYVVSEGAFIRQKFLSKSIPVEKMLTITRDEEIKMPVLYYADDKSPNDGISFVILSTKRLDDLIEDIRALNPHVSIDTLTKKEK